MNFTLYQYKYISKDDSTYLKGLAILIMICLHLSLIHISEPTRP